MRYEEFLLEKPVESSWIINLMHNRPNKVLTMRLSNGRAYAIDGISRTTFEKWTKSPSIGQFFHNNIKQKYTLRRVK